MQHPVVQLWLLGLCLVRGILSQPTATDLDFCKESATLWQIARSVEILTEQTKALSVSLRLFQEQSLRDNKVTEQKLAQLSQQSDHIQVNFSSKLEKLEESNKGVVEKALSGLEYRINAKTSVINEQVLSVIHNQSTVLENILVAEVSGNIQNTNNQEKLLSNIQTALNETVHNGLVSPLTTLQPTLHSIHVSQTIIANQTEQSIASVQRSLETSIAGIGDQVVSIVSAIIEDLTSKGHKDNTTVSLNTTDSLDNSTIPADPRENRGDNLAVISSGIISLVETFQQTQNSDIRAVVQDISGDSQRELVRAVSVSQSNLTALVRDTGLGARITAIQDLLRNGEVCPKKIIADIMGSVKQPQSGMIRLVNGTTKYNGRVEMYYKGKWGTVCDDSWSGNDARVVCRQLGFCGGSSTSGGSYGKGAESSPIHLDDVACGGSEANLLQCRSSTVGRHNCGHGEDAGAKCTPCT